MWIRRLLFAGPLVVLGAFVVAFLVARPYFDRRIEQLTIGSIAEPERLNPILSTTTTAAAIQYFVFDSLLDLDENAEIKLSLAERYELAQTSRLYFRTIEEAARAARRIEAHRADWPQVALRSVTADGDAVVLQLDKPGTAYRELLRQWLGRASPLDVQRWRIAVDTNVTWQDRPLTSDVFIDWLRRQEAEKRLAKPRVLYAWRNTSVGLEVYTLDADGAFLDAIHRRFAAHIGAEVKPAADRSAAPAEQDRMQPRLAGPLKIVFDKSWPAQDEPVITFRLRKGIKWHDGAPFTAADVRFTYEKLMDEKVASPRRSDYELIKSLQVPDDYTVRVTYKEPFSPCLYSWMMPIIPYHLLKDEDDLRNPVRTNFDRRPIGLGAYKFAQWVTDQQIVLQRNDEYWQGRPHLPRVAYRIIPDPTVSQLEFATGGYDYTPLEPHQVRRFERDGRYDVYSGQSNSYSYIGWNLRRPYFQDKRVRLALAHAIDVQAIIKYVLYGYGQPCTGPFAPVTPWWNPKIKPIPYDPQRARQLLAEAGWRDTDGDGILEKDGEPFRFTLITNNGNPVRRDIAVLVQRYLKQIGIEVQVNLYEWTVFIEKFIDPRNFDACVLGWSLGFDHDLYQLWHSSQIHGRALNFVSYVNPQVDRLLESARTEFDVEKIKQYCYRLAELIYADQPYLFLFYPQSNAAMPKGLYRVRRPGPDGTWIDEPIRRTRLGFTIYQKWWMRSRPVLTP